MKFKIPSFFQTAIITAAVFVFSTSAAGWWNANWKYRRLVKLPASARPSKLSGRDVAVVDMPTAGKTKTDGSDVRVTTITGKLIPSKVLMTGPGDSVRVAFNPAGAARQYYVYFGNPDAEKPERPQFSSQRGVLLEMWQYPGGKMDTFEQVKKIAEKANRLIGRDYIDRIFLGHNPFGRQNKIFSIYTTHLIVRKSGDYTFCTSSHDASFMTIDGNLVVSNGGQHGPQRIAMREGKLVIPHGRIKLSRGLHELKFYHASTGGVPVAVAAWMPPGHNRPRPIPPGAYPPVIRATPGPMRQAGKDPDIDFVPIHAGETFANDRYFQRYIFEAMLVGNTKVDVQWKWDFGDGQTSTETDVQHVYLKDGMYTVTLTGKTPAGVLKRTNRISVSRPWDRVTHRNIDDISLHAKIVAGYDFSTLDAQAAARGVNLLKRVDHTKGLLSAGAGFLKRESAPAKTVEEILPIYTDALLDADRPERAVESLLKAVKMTDDAGARAKMLAPAGRIALNELADDELAMKLFQKVVSNVKKNEAPQAVRKSYIGIGDVWRARGQYDKAMKFYKISKQKFDVKRPENAPFVRGDLARQVESYSRRGDFELAGDTLQKWADKFPEDKLQGYWSLLKVRVLMRRKEYAKAAREAEILADVNPASNHAAKLLMRAATCYRTIKKTGKAAAALNRIIDKYPESPLAAEAGKLLGELTSK